MSFIYADFVNKKIDQAQKSWGNRNIYILAKSWTKFLTANILKNKAI